jgi:hypothetical protein
MKTWLEEAYKLKGVTPEVIKEFFHLVLEEAYKLD